VVEVEMGKMKMERTWRTCTTRRKVCDHPGDNTQVHAVDRDVGKKEDDPEGALKEFRAIVTTEEEKSEW
jgi:hypothetical protein